MRIDQILVGISHFLKLHSGSSKNQLPTRYPSPNESGFTNNYKNVSLLFFKLNLDKHSNPWTTLYIMADRFCKSKPYHSGTENFKKSRQKNLWNQINQIFFVKLHLFKKNSCNWFIWFHEFFGLDFLKFSVPLCVVVTIII